jgi:hypothetical protein
LLEENREPISYELVWLGKILKAIGEKSVSWIWGWVSGGDYGTAWKDNYRRQAIFTV